MSETGWLIESIGKDLAPRWLETLAELDADGWTKDSNKALRFARHVDASTFVEYYLGEPPEDAIRVTEHRWLGGGSLSSDRESAIRECAALADLEVTRCMQKANGHGLNTAKAVRNAIVAKLTDTPPLNMNGTPAQTRMRKLLAATLDMFLSAYQDRPGNEPIPLLPDDDLLTWGDLRAILRLIEDREPSAPPPPL